MIEQEKEESSKIVQKLINGEISKNTDRNLLLLKRDNLEKELKKIISEQLEDLIKK